MENKLLKIENLKTQIEGKDILKGLNLEIGKGEIHAIMGPNGAGKSTLMKAVLDLIPKDKGYVQILGEGIRSVRKSVAYVPQRSDIDWDFPITVLDVVLIGTYPSLGMMKRPKKGERDWAFECLKKVGMEEFKHRQIGELSGGQQQRICIARALAVEPEVLLMDEPTSALDPISTNKIEDLCQDLKSKYTIIMVTHNMQQAARISDKTAFFLTGEVIEFNNTDILFSKPEDKRTEDYITGRFG